MLVGFYLFPTLYVLSTSLKLPVDYFSIAPSWIPTTVTLANYEKMFVDYQAGTAPMNSLLIATLVTPAMSVPVAYAIARYRVGGGALGFWTISQRMLPAVAVVIPFFLTFLGAEPDQHLHHCWRRRFFFAHGMAEFGDEESVEFGRHEVDGGTARLPGARISTVNWTGSLL